MGKMAIWLINILAQLKTSTKVYKGREFGDMYFIIIIVIVFGL